MPKDRNHNYKPLIALAVILFLWVVLPPIVKQFGQDLFYELQAPAWIAGSFVRDVQDFWTFRMKSKQEMIEENLEMARLRASYRYQLQEKEALEAQIQRLESLFELPSLPVYKAEVSRIARRDINAWWQQITVRKGRNFEIPEGAPVIFSRGVVGKVRSVHLNTSVIDLITSPNIRLAAIFEGDERPVLYQGVISGPFSKPGGSVSNVPTDIQIDADRPRRLMTSGFGGVFPAGLTIGWVHSLQASSDGLFQSGRVELDPDLHVLREVAILKLVD
ncbi:MAG: rod shape-determining protein MreC [Opitutae bacterium]|nr:rod shape-determining protein MreC [Opitutae bacterium]